MKTICPICKKPITAGQSFSCSVVGQDKDGKILVEKTHLDCRCSQKYEPTKKVEKIIKK